MTAARPASLDALLAHVAERLVADEQPVESRVAVVDGRDTLAAVIIRPATGTNGEDSISVEANAHGISKAVVAYALRQAADQFDAAAEAEGDEPITPDEAAAEQLDRVDEPPALTADDVRAALDFNAPDRDPALATLRDVLLDDAPHTPEQALAAARIILSAHARHLAALVERKHESTQSRWGLNRSTRGLLTGYSGARRAVRAYADRLDDEQALAEHAAIGQAQP
ncbi:hypothetical protein [Streptomyces silvensis]|uniref:hypothetical protein n=1 Tax=Streptomyces silvensis TaxID=1765722 RepID=UPI0007C6584D|nr:hypothetical protein [Streptomyces silvensis]